MSDTMTVPANGFDMTPTFGPLYWGFLCSLVLTGINLQQGYIYFPSKDRPAIQAIALSMLALNVASAALVAQSVYYYLVPHFGSLAPLNAITDELSAECLISSLITLISQGYFAVQLYTLTKGRRESYFIPLLVAVLAFLAFAFGVACTTVMIVHKHSVLSDRSATFSIFFGLAKGFGAVTDIVATVAMCFMLAQAKSGMLWSSGIIRALIQYIMRRGVLVTLIQTLLLLTFHAAPGHLYWLAFHVNVTKLYANTFFSMLNGREHLNKKRTRGGMSVYTSQHENKHISRYSPPTPCEEEDFDIPVEEAGYGKGFPVNSPMPLVTKTVLVSQM